MSRFITDTSATPPAADAAREALEEMGVLCPDVGALQLISVLTRGASTGDGDQAIAITPSAALVGLALYQGFPDTHGHVTVIDNENEHLQLAKATFAECGIPGNRTRFLPTQPLEVMGRLNLGSYRVIYGDVSPLDMPAFINAAWPLLTDNGMLILTGTLLDGTVADDTRTDRDTNAARDADFSLRHIDDALVARLPLASGLTIAVKAPAGDKK